MKKGPFVITGIYFFLGSLWILYSDWFVHQAFENTDFEKIALAQNLKGGFFILSTSVLLYFLIKLSQKQLTVSQRKYLEMFKMNPNPMLIFNTKDKCIIESNLAAQKLYGYERDEMCAIALNDFFIDPPSVLNTNLDHSDLHPKSLELTKHRTKNGDIIDVNVAIQPIVFDKNAGMLIMVQDISQQKEYEKQLLDLTRNLENKIEERTNQLNHVNKELANYNQQLTISNQQLHVANERIQEQNEIIQKQNEENLNRILSSLNDVVWSFDLRDKKYLYLSKSAEQITGKSYQLLKDDIKEWVRMIFPEDRHIIKKRHKTLFKEGYYESTYRLYRADHEILWIHDKVHLIKDNHGNPLRIEGIASDITNLKKAQNEIIGYSNRLDLILESITDGFFIMDKTYKFVRVNCVLEQLLGIPREDIAGKHLREVLPFEPYQDLYNQVENAMTHDINLDHQGYFPVLDKWLDIKYYPYSEGISAFIRDVTKEKNTQREIYFSKKNLDALINNTNDLIWSIDKNKRLVSANRAFTSKVKRISGVRLTKGDHLLNGTLQEYNLEKWDELYTRALNGGSFSIVNELGDESYEISFNPIFDEKGEVFGVGCFGRDITERRKHEKERSQLIGELIERNKGLEEFGYVTSHKVRAPVASILGLINVMNNQKVNLENGQLKSFLDYLSTSANSLDQTLKDLTSILDMQKSRLELKENVDLNVLCDRIKRMLKPAIQESQAIIHCDFSKADKIYTIKSYLLNILVNLISNSINYKRPYLTPEITVSTDTYDDLIIISVSDNGLGIDMEKYKDQLFHLYKRFHLHTSGKGMGLYLVKSQVEALNGKLEVVSEVNQGTTIRVIFKQDQEIPVLN